MNINKFIIKLMMVVAILLFVAPFSACQSKTSKDTEINKIQKINMMATPINDTEIKFDTMGYPIVTKEFEMFDFETYEKRPPANVRGWRNNEYIQKLLNGTVIGLVGRTDELYCEIYYPDSPFQEFRAYYPNGYIQKKGLSYVQGFQKGIWYEFDETGKLIRETDYDKAFEFTFEDIEKFCTKNNIRIEKGYDSLDPEREVEGIERYMMTRIYRNCFEGFCQWEIEYVEKIPETEYDYIQINIVLDGKTGKIISKTQKPFWVEI